MRYILIAIALGAAIAAAATLWPRKGGRGAVAPTAGVERLTDEDRLPRGASGTVIVEYTLPPAGFVGGGGAGAGGTVAGSVDVQDDGLYLVVEMVAGTVLGGRDRPVIGPMDEVTCLAIAGAIEGEEVPSIASVKCARPIGAYICPEAPGSLWRYGRSCPLFEGEMVPSGSPQNGR